MNSTARKKALMNVQNTHHKYAIFKRISSLILLILCVVICVNLYFMHSQNAAKWYQVESEQLGRSLTLQAARLISSPLALKDQQTINQYVAIISQGKFVKGAVLFDELGVRHTSPDNEQNEHFSVVEILKQRDSQALIFVEDIVFEGNIIGYIKLLLDKEAVTEHHRNFNQNQLFQSLLIIVLSFCAAALATRLFYKMRRSYRLVETEDDLP